MAALDVVAKALQKVFGSRNERLVKRYSRVAEQISDLETELRGDFDRRFEERAAPLLEQSRDQGTEPEQLEAELQKIRVELSGDLRERTERLKARLAAGEQAQDILPEAFATLREASRRARAHRHFGCQLVGGMVLYDSCVAEMKTGEGKTIVCHLASYLHMLQGNKVHIVTVNDYLVKRDAEFAKPIFELVGGTVGYIQAQVDSGGHEGIRHQQYACDLTYGTNSEFGFDYLRDNMKLRLEEQVQGSLDYVIVDEVDSILIDEARTPLIISGPAEDDVSRYKWADDIARKLVHKQRDLNNETARRLKEWAKNPPEGAKDNPKFEEARKRFAIDPYMLTDEEAEAINHRQLFVVQRERKAAHLTHEGVQVAQDEAGIGSFYIGTNMDRPHLIENALRAHQVYERDGDYVVQNREIIIVDEFTGRLMIGRQWSDGLHQAIEAKENVPIKQETQTMATITIQNYFKLYDRLAGMTGTAMTESEEFMKIYKLEVVSVPTNRPVNRVDSNDRIYRTIPDKYAALVEEIHEVHRRGRPGDPFLLAGLLKALSKIEKQQGRETDYIAEALSAFE
jgi:preprotein translocase subunit SecA